MLNNKQTRRWIAVMVLLGLISQSNSFAQSENTTAKITPEDAPPISLNLKQAIDRAMLANPSIQESQLGLRISEIEYDDAWDLMFMPQISLALSSGAAKTVGYLPGADSSTPNHGYPTSTATLGLGQYTLYNFGKDKLAFDKAKVTWTRSKQVFEELKRSVRFSVINSFWALKSRMDQLDAYDRSVEIATAVVNLQESRVRIKKATETEVSSSTVDLMAVKNLRDGAESEAKNALFTLNVLLGDEVGTRYRIDDEVSFLPIKVTEEILYQTYEKESPSIKDAQTSLLKSEIDYNLAVRNRLPLPTISFSGVNLAYGNNYYGGKTSAYTSAPGRKNLDVSAAMSLTIPLTGPGGLFGKRVTQYYELTRDTKEIQMLNTANRDRQTIFNYVQSIRQYEQNVENSREGYKNAMSVMQSVLDRFMNKEAVSRLDIRDAVTQARDSEIALNNAILLHLSYKTLLAGFIGVDYLPRME